MRTGVFSRLRYRLFCLIAGHLTGQKERFLWEHDWARAGIPYEKGSEGSEEKNLEGKKDTEKLHRQLAWMRALCEADRKFLAGLDLRSVTDALLETVVQLFPGSATTVWLFDGTTHRLEAVACRNPREPEGKLIVPDENPNFVIEVVEKKRPAMITNVGACSGREDIKFLRNQGLAVFLGIPMLSRDEIVGVLALYSRVPHS